MTSTRMAAAFLFVTIAAVSLVGKGGDPEPSAMQEMFDLSARRMKLLLELDFVDRRLATLETEQFGQFTRVADPTGSIYSEHLSDDVLSARATQDIVKGELLLYHAPGIYRMKDSKPKLATKGECWYFRPDRDIRKGKAFSIALIHDAPEERDNVARGFAPHSSRARDPERAYRTEITIPRE